MGGGALDIFDVVEAMRRQKWLLLGGFAVLVLVIVGAMFEVETGSLTPRLAPRYEAEAEILVVPEGVEDLTSPGLTSEDLSGEASVYARLLSTDQAAQEISEQTGSELLAWSASAGSRSPIIVVTAESPTAEGAKAAAATGALVWLEQRLKSGITIANIPATEDDEEVVIPEPVDSRQVTVLSEPRFDDVDPDLWIEFLGPDDKGLATPLNALESELSFTSDLGNSPRITISVGPEVGSPFDTLTVLAPENEDSPRPPLELVLRRGAILFDIDGTPTINPSAVTAEWEFIAPESDLAEVSANGVALILIDEDPSATQLGQRRGPIISAGAFLAGILLLLVFALMRDTFQRRKRALAEGAAPVVVLADQRVEEEAFADEDEEDLVEVDELEFEDEPVQRSEGQGQSTPWDWRRAVD